MKIISSITEMQEITADARQSGKRIAFVPTMGFLHEGHASLLREGRRRSDLLVLSIFVNPSQFGFGEDFERYPRDMERDSRIAAEAGVDVIFTPTATGMYPAGFQSWVNVEELTLPLCGASRPGHFRGVTTVVCKLFNIVNPHLALFGKKDFQQLAVIRRMAADLNMPVEIVGMPIIREADGLAMSSRNKYLSDADRKCALCLSRAIMAARSAFRGGELSAEIIMKSALAEIGREQGAVIDYVELRDSTTLAECDRVNGNTLLALALKIGSTRLIDNGVLGEDD
ncbi:pantothenate synthetase [Geobacter sp. OR-1]|uniref:pantoate--beta-alanine ligase n=1 Tax=Geobacter sp. OR-1 TaxID=1266765 RepID=UPI000542628F|nr:pantoate--beta-alanine ligase [Geobacter sp. OR-1]GAM10048.1 pantothenate synthetase [Geobacter sp. OR-1]